MLRALLMCLVAAVSTAAPAQELKPSSIWGSGPKTLRIATGSPGELGLLEVLATDFARRENASVHWFKAGSGQAMGYLKDRKVDMILAHAPPAERKAVAEGWRPGASCSARTNSGSSGRLMIRPRWRGRATLPMR